MMKRLTIWVLVLVLCLGAAAPAMASNSFAFAKKELTVFEGKEVETKLKRQGSYAGSGKIVYASADPSIVKISEDGVITGVKKGKAQVTASLMRNGKRVARTTATVTVRRAVTKVTLNTTKLSVYEPDDPEITSLLKEPTEHRVLVIPAGKTAALSATCTPSSASSLRVKFTTSDEGIAKINDTYLKAIQQGECNLTVSSVLNPKVRETFRVLVIRPVTKINIKAGTKKVEIGETLQLSATCLPGNASIRKVKWKSMSPTIAKVDRNGMVTGLKVGNASIVAKATDGSGVEQAVRIAVIKPVTNLSITESVIPVIAGRGEVYAKVKVQPSDATDKSVTWSTSNKSIAKVGKGGQVTGVKAGECLLIAKSNSNPEVKATAKIVVTQLVTKIENANTKSALKLRVGESLQTKWNVLPDDATDKRLTFTSNHPRIATVDKNGVVHAVNRGVATITATAKDSGRRRGTIDITVIQPVTGVSIQYPLYYVQRSSFRLIRAIVQPDNANNKKVLWSSSNEYVARVASHETSTGKATGIVNGTATIYAYTEDGGFTAATQVKVGDFVDAIRIRDLYVDGNNEIRIALQNISDVTIRNVHFTIACYDENQEAFVCNTNGKSMYFEGDYNGNLRPYARSGHGSFHFKNALIDRPLGSVVITIVSWTDKDGIKFPIPEYDRPSREWTGKLHK